MPKFSLSVAGVASGAVVGTYKTVLALKAGAAQRGKLKALRLSGGGEAPQDVNVTARVIRSNNDTDGTLTALVPTEKDSQGPASIMTCGHTATVEPTTLESTAAFIKSFNARGGLQEFWPEGQEIVWGPAQTLLIQVTPGAAVAVKCDATVDFEE